jgi:hypothetical protein
MVCGLKAEIINGLLEPFQHKEESLKGNYGSGFDARREAVRSAKDLCNSYR